ncbi:aminopeptidase P family protein [Azorhizobium doebereinerae]|uniref:aminopeptidase P family protein n=1 Tax=Azorhizobium doebereinerae TaxID=281091 RepID=UPI0003F68DF3|nr:aminopeptidase P family protein [Azorhizobium doebereinerae]
MSQMPPPPAPARRFRAEFQSFDETADGSAGPARLAALRAELERRGVGGYVVPRADAHQNEYVPPGEERLAWLTGFTGSAGLLVVLPQVAALFVDGRYTLQAAAQVDGDAFTIVPLAETTPERWLEANLPAGLTLGFDPWRTTLDGRDKFARAVAAARGVLVGVADDPVAAIWADRPLPPSAPLRLLDPALAGEDAGAKLERVQAVLAKEKVGGALISDPHATAWLFNVRGGDVAHTPLPLAWSLVPAEGRAQLFLSPAKLSPAVREALAPVVDIRPEDELEAALAAFAVGRALRLDQATAPVHLAEIVERAGGTVAKGADPVSALKARKNAAEIAGMRAAHLRDGVALTRFLHWFDGAAASGTLTEIEAVEALETFRRETGQLTDVSFPTISGAGPNGAIVHYRVTRATNRTIAPGDLFLLDSGAQYPDGTTDVTRTMAVGTPSPDMRAHFTLVLKGHIALARAVFPKGATGAQLDTLARQFLWAAGLDFEHGTGHGVGAGLSVHEGPARISKLGHVALEPGMILSNEPGYYRTGAYGIRIENLILVEPREMAAGGKSFLGFETLTLAPIDRRLIDTALLTAGEAAWIDSYHARVAASIGPLLDPAARAWMEAATAPLE